MKCNLQKPACLSCLPWVLIPSDWEMQSFASDQEDGSMPQASPEQVQSIHYFLGWAGDWKSWDTAHQQQQSQAAPQGLDFPSLTAGISVQAEHVWGVPSPRGRMGKGQRGSKGGWCWELTAVARTSPPHWEHTQLTLGKGLPKASQIPRDDSNGSHGFRTQAAPPCCLSFSAMYHTIAIKMQSFYSLHNFNYF